MLWLEVDLLSHPISACLALFMAGRRGGNWAGPTFLSLLLGWGSLPLVILLTRESRPIPSSGGQGLNPSESSQAGSDWDEWRSYYFHLRQDLVVQVLLGLIGLGYLVILVMELLWPAALVQGQHLLGEGRVASMLWAASIVWPSVVGWLAVSGYWFPWLGLIWRYSDQIWRSSGLQVPCEVDWRSPAGPTPAPEEARLALLAAVARSRGLHTSTLLIWLILVLLLVAGIATTVYQLRAQFFPAAV